jgi:hypothetical protein
MCHEYYEAWWRKAESTAKKTEDVKPEVVATATPRRDEEPNPVPERAAEKELVPAE